MSDSSGVSQEVKRLKVGEHDETSTSETDGPWNTIIVNQIPPEARYKKLISIFSQYGNIETTYLCKRPIWGDEKHERVAKLTFSNEDDALKVWEASQEKLIKYENDVLMVTLASSDYSPIQNLPDTCLREIFKRVNCPMDKLKVELVCRRWRDQGRCCWSSIKEMGVYGCGINVWRTIFPRVADSLEYLHFSHQYPGSAAILGLAAEHCVHLKRLKFVCCDMNEKLRNRHMHTLLRKNENIRRFHLYLDTVDVNKRFMEILPAELYEFDMRATSDDPILPTVVLSRFQNLRVLILYYITIPDNQAFDHFTNLEQLALLECHISPSSVSRILRNNQSLKFLDIGDNSLTDASLMYLQQLPNLQVLVMQSARFTDEHLQGMRSLKGLSCSECPRITDEGIQNYLDRASHMTHLSIFKCSITLELIAIARAWTIRTGKSLKLFVDDRLFQAYSASGGLHTDGDLQVNCISTDGVHDATWANWFRDLVE